MENASNPIEFHHFFTVELDVFNGPIDLLLHLVKQQELELEKVSLAKVASQYLECLEKMRDLDLDVASEYLVIAATLVSIKSSLILDEPVELVEDEEGNLVDPHEELLRKLREAAVYKEGAEYLGDRSVLGIDVFQSQPNLRHVGTPEVKFKDHDPLLLGKAFRKMIENLDELQATYTVTLESVSVVQRMVDVMDRLKANDGKASFESLVGDKTSKGSIVATFISLLELCKRQAIAVYQDDSFGAIMIALSTVEIDVASLGSEFDEDPEDEEGSEIESEEVKIVNG